MKVEDVPLNSEVRSVVVTCNTIDVRSRVSEWSSQSRALDVLGSVTRDAGRV